MSLSIASSPPWRTWLSVALVAAAVAGVFLAYPFGPWLVWNIAAPTAGLVATLLAARRMSRLVFRCALIASLGWFGIAAAVEWFHRARLPPDVGVRGIVAEGSQAGFNERCGAVVFRLDAATLAQLRTSGVADLTAALPLEREWPTATGWLPTPLPSEIVRGAGPDALNFGGLDCSLSPMWAWSIRHAAGTEGSFYRLGARGILVLSPASGVVAAAYNSRAWPSASPPSAN